MLTTKRNKKCKIYLKVPPWESVPGTHRHKDNNSAATGHPLHRVREVEGTECRHRSHLGWQVFQLVCSDVEELKIGQRRGHHCRQAKGKGRRERSSESAFTFGPRAPPKTSTNDGGGSDAQQTPAETEQRHTNIGATYATGNESTDSRRATGPSAWWPTPAGPRHRSFRQAIGVEWVGGGVRDLSVWDLRGGIRKLVTIPFVRNDAPSFSFLRATNQNPPRQTHTHTHTHRCEAHVRALFRSLSTRRRARRPRSAASTLMRLLFASSTSSRTRPRIASGT